MSKYSITQPEVHAGARALFLTIQTHRDVSDAVGFDWEKLPSAARAVLKAAQEAESETTP